jgi:AcrB/AcrD/AcrF family
MTAGAMVLGMIPMSLGVGEGGEQNAPLARAVIGGLLFATFATLIFVPAMYRLLRSQPATSGGPANHPELALAAGGAGGGASRGAPGSRGFRPHDAGNAGNGNVTARISGQKGPL